MKSKLSQETLAKYLTYSGALPLLICAILMFALPEEKNNISLIAHTYSAVIISFLSGTHWAVYLFFSDKCHHNLFISSNIITVTAWLSVIIPMHEFVLLLQSFCFLILLFLDRQILNDGILPEWFYDLRRNGTIIVVFTLAIIGCVA